MKKIILLSISLLFTQFLSAAPTDTMAVKTIQGITDKMLEIISGPIDKPRDWDAYRNLFLPTAQKISVRSNAEPNRQVRVMNLEEFVRYVGPLYKRDGFLEVATGLTVHEYNGIATAFQSYHAKNLLGTYEQKGINCYQLVFSKNRWWIANTVFVSENPDDKIPVKYLKKR